MKRSIFLYTLMLAAGGALAAAVASAIVVFVVPVPLTMPLSTLEVGRLLAGKPIARRDLSPRVMVTARRDALPSPTNAAERAFGRIIARQLGRPPADVRFAFRRGGAISTDPGVGIAQRSYEQNMLASERLYGDDPRFGGLLLGPFTAAVRLNDGTWRVVNSGKVGPGPQWQIGVVRLIALALAVIVPFAWFGSRRLALPIRAFARSADRVGRGSFEDVPLAGPEEIRQAAAALNDMQKRLDTIIKERTAMIGAVAHDLRTPLARLRFIAAPLPDAERTRIEGEIAGMERMIATTLDFVHSQAVSPDLSPVDLSLVVQGVVDDFADLGKDVRFDAGGPVTMVGDPVLLARLFSNLIGNAVTYGGGARVALETQAGRAIVTVGDQGPGMATADLARAFEPFFRADRSRSASTGGIGLGLAIVQLLARVHGGSVALANGDKGGLVATVRLPIIVR